MKINKTCTRLTEIDLEDAVEYIFDLIDPTYFKCSWEECLEEIDFSDMEISDSEKTQLIQMLEKRFYEIIEELKEEEIEFINKRNKIIDFIQDRICSTAYEGEIGFILNPEEIVETIIKNYNRI